MAKRWSVLVLAAAVVFLGGLAVLAQDATVKDPESKHGLTLKARKSTEEEFGKDTKRYGVELYEDRNNGNGLYISDVGSVAAVPSKYFKAGDGKGREPLFRYGLKLTARPAAERDTDKGKKYGLELFKDETSGCLVYINENGDIDAIGPTAANDAAVKGKPKDPTRTHAWNLKVRKAGDKDWEGAVKFGVEVFKDPNNGNLIYITDTGSFAAVPGKLVEKEETGKSPDWQHGMEVSVRKAGEKDFSKDTKKYGMEVFLDGNNGCLIYLTENGNIAVVPGKLAKTSDKSSPKGPELKHGMELQVRKPDEKDFGKGSKKYGVECYADGNNGFLLYVCETGDISVVSTKAE